MDIKEEAKKRLTNYDEIWAGIEARKSEFGENYEIFANSILRREMKKLTINPPIENTFILLGFDVTDFAAVFRKKVQPNDLGEYYYPPKHFNEGNIIPEHDYSIAVYLMDSNKKIQEVNTKNIIHVLSGDIGKLVDVKIQQTNFGGMLKEIKLSEETKDPSGLLKDLACTIDFVNTADLTTFTTPINYKKNPLVLIDNVTCLEQNVTKNLVISTIDDESCLDNNLTMTVFSDKHVHNFSEEGLNLQLVGFVSKNDEGQLNMNLIGAITPDIFKMTEKPKKMTDEDEQKKEDVGGFL